MRDSLRVGLWRNSMGHGRRTIGTAIIALVAVLVTLSSTGAAVAKLQATDETPATGHAEVIAQGVAELPDIPAIWRVAKLEAQPAERAPVAERLLGFALADEEPVLVTDAGTGNETRLGPGEALFVHQGAQQTRASLSGDPVPYYIIDFMPASDAGILGNAELVFASDDFAAPSGRRDLDLVRDVLQPKEVSTLAQGFTPTLVLVTEGTVKVTPEGGEAVTLRSGDAATFDAALSIKATGSRQAAYVAAVVGSDTKPVSKPIEPAPTPTSTAATTPTGSIGIAMYACPEGSTIENFVPETCAPAGDVASWTLAGNTLARNLTTADGVYENGTLVWHGIPFGEYVVWPNQYAEGYGDYYIRASAGVARNEDGSTSVTIDWNFPIITLEAYVFPEG
jgi:hypothetical protein